MRFNGCVWYLNPQINRQRAYQVELIALRRVIPRHSDEALLSEANCLTLACYANAHRCERLKRLIFALTHPNKRIRQLSNFTCQACIFIDVKTIRVNLFSLNERTA